MDKVIEREKKISGSGKMETANLAIWLAQRCRDEKLSYRQAATKAGVSHATIAAIQNGTRPSAATIVKLAGAFSAEGQHQKGVLEDYLLGLCGYRSSRPEATRSEPIAMLMDKLGRLNEENIQFVESFVDFTATLGNGHIWGDQRL